MMTSASWNLARHAYLLWIMRAERRWDESSSSSSSSCSDAHQCCPLFISCDTDVWIVIRSHHDTIKPPHFRLISRFQPKSHLHSLRGVTQTDSLQKNTLFNEFLNPHSNPVKPWDPALTLRVMEFHLWTISINTRWQVINFLSAFSSPTSIFNR